MVYELSKGETPFAASPPIRMYQKIIQESQISMPTFFSSPLKVQNAKMKTYTLAALIVAFS